MHFVDSKWRGNSKVFTSSQHWNCWSLLSAELLPCWHLVLSWISLFFCHLYKLYCSIFLLINKLKNYIRAIQGLHYIFLWTDCQSFFLWERQGKTERNHKLIHSHSTDIASGPVNRYHRSVLSLHIYSVCSERLNKRIFYMLMCCYK